MNNTFELFSLTCERYSCIVLFLNELNLTYWRLISFRGIVWLHSNKVVPWGKFLLCHTPIRPLSAFQDQISILIVGCVWSQGSHHNMLPLSYVWKHPSLLSFSLLTSGHFFWKNDCQQPLTYAFTSIMQISCRSLYWKKIIVIPSLEDFYWSWFNRKVLDVVGIIGCPRCC
jgi:hypothetical protein